MWKSKGGSFFILFLVVLFCLIVSEPCSSQDKPEEFIEPYELAKEETFYSKGLFLKEVPLEESPVPASVYEREFLERFGFKNLRDFLDYLPSYYLTSGYGERSITFRGFRSLTSASVLFLEDGFRITSPDYESLPLDWAYPFLDVERIELMYGAGGSIYGAGSFSGVVNLERRYNPKEKEASLTLGELGETRAFFKLSQGPISLSGYHVERGAERINGAKSYEVDTARSLSGKLFLGNTEVSFLLAEEETLIERKIDGSPDISPQLKGLLGNKLKVRFYSLGLKREGFLGEWKWTIKPSVSVLEAEIPFYTTNSSFPAYKNYLKPQRWDFTAYASRNFKGWDLTLGTEWQLRRLNSYHTDFYVGIRAFSYAFPDDDDLLYAFFFSTAKTFGRASLHLGGRYERYEDYPGRFIPRLGFSYKLSPNLSFVLSYTEGVNIPSFYHQKNRSVGSYSFRKLSLEKEKTLQASLVYAASKGIFLRNTLFYQVQKDRIWRDPQVQAEINLPKFSVSGFESELKLRLREHLAFLNLTLFKVEEDKPIPFIYDGKYIAGIPRFMLKGGFSFRLPLPYEAYLSPSFKVIGNTKAKDGEGVSPYSVFDFYLLFKPKPFFDLGFRVENLFDKHYQRAGGGSKGVPWEGRRTSFDLNFKF
jgi:outer membrane receptor protein involved in Fe transport